MITFEPFVAPIVIDKISIVLQVPTEMDKKAIVQFLLHGLEDTESGFQKAYPNNTYANAFTLSIKAPLSGTDCVLIQANPVKKTNAFLRVEFNPSKAGTSGMDLLRQHCAAFLDYDYTTLVKAGRVTRMDVAMDLMGIRLDDLAARSVKLKKSTVHSAVDGGTETVYLGATKGNRRIRIYDKGKQLGETGQKLPSFPVTRVEAELRNVCMLRNIPALGNPFTDVGIWYLPEANFAGEDHIWRMFLDSVSRRGLRSALKQIPDSYRQPFNDALHACPLGMWDPGKHWAYWPKRVDDSELLLEACHWPKEHQKGYQVA